MTPIQYLEYAGRKLQADKKLHGKVSSLLIHPSDADKLLEYFKDDIGLFYCSDDGKEEHEGCYLFGVPLVRSYTSFQYIEYESAA